MELSTSFKQPLEIKQNEQPIPAKAWKRLVAFLMDAVVIYLFSVIFALLIVTPTLNKMGYKTVIQTYNDKAVEHNIGEYNAEGKYVAFPAAEVLEESIENFWADPVATKAATQKVYYDLANILVGPNLALIIAFFVIPLILGRGQTLGKKILNIGLVTNTGAKITIRHIFMRVFIGWILIEGVLSLITAAFIGLPLIILISGISVLFSGKKKAIHDIVAGTIVVDAYLAPKLSKEKNIGNYINNEKIGE